MLALKAVSQPLARPPDRTAIALDAVLEAAAAAPGAEVDTAKVRKRRPPILPRGQRFATEQERQQARREVLALRVASALPVSLQVELLGGENGLRQVPEPAMREEILTRIVTRHAGPQGDALLTAEFALQVLRDEAERSGASDELCMPVSSVLAHRLLLEVQKAPGGSAASGERLLKGMTWLHEKFKLLIDLDPAVVGPAVPPPGSGKRAPRGKAGTLPLQATMTLETIAADPRPSQARFIARSLLAFGLDQSVRVQDMARVKVRRDRYTPDTVSSGTTVTASKDGTVLDLSACIKCDT